jgi:hypothetical protein
MLWILTRALDSNDGKHNIPSWACWVSLTGGTGNSDDVQQSIVDFLAPVFAPVTENSTVQHILKLSQCVSRAVNQMYAIATFDLAVVMKAYAIVWEKSQTFKGCYCQSWGFHLLCSYMGALGKSIRCSGFEEILVESGIFASGSIENVMSGKDYNRALRVHKLVFEALERLLLQEFESRHSDLMSDEARSVLHNLARKPCIENVAVALDNKSCKAMLSQFLEFQEEIREGKLGKTAMFWMNYIIHG